MGNYKYDDVESAIKLRNGWKDEHDNSRCEILDLEIDQVCDNWDSCNANGLCNGARHNIPLYKYSEVPSYLKGNPYVVEGYRSTLSFSFCLKSLFLLSNETVNIWSHLVGFFLFFSLMLWDGAIFLPSINGSVSDYIIITIGLMCYQFCMLCSSGYHLFMCHSEKASRRWLSLDLTGISIGLLGCYLPAVHYAFYCLSIWRDVYMVIITVLFGAVFYFQTNPLYYTDRWFRRRLALYVCLSVYGVVPSIHWVLLNGGISSDIVQMFLPKVAVMYLFAVIAFVFYVSKMPERCLPGKCDYLGSSHQLWHIMVVVCFYWWHKSGQEMLLYRLGHTCT